MKTLDTTPIEPIFSVIRTEILAAVHLLQSFEASVSFDEAKGGNQTKEMQGFDLALQILSDVEHLVEVFGQQFSPESVLPQPLPVSGISLERVRSKITMNQGQKSEIKPQNASEGVELF